ncbi:MAG: hypothetical protein HY865_13435 [Chloroflexi bacterium]|nr:hypothetical protein [Chloroflexota bacterium]
MTSKITNKSFVLLIIVLSLSSMMGCTALAPTPTLTATSTITPVPSETPIPTATPSPTSLPTLTATYTAFPTKDSYLSPASVQSREQFEEFVASGNIRCQGSDAGGSSVVVDFHNEAVAAGIISEGQLTLGSGIPSTENPTQCLFLITFYDGNSVIIYKEGDTGEFAQLLIIE